MVGDSKILTVSYGTFSCTLEGFDDPFSTMKAIAEYFRDLAAGDRFFGAEPPQPDTDLLHRIAEETIQRQVNAEVSGDSLILRQADTTPAPVRAPVAAPAVQPAEVAEDAPLSSVAEKLKRIRAVVANEAARNLAFDEDQHADAIDAEPVAEAAPVTDEFAAPELDQPVEEDSAENFDVASFIADDATLEDAEPVAPAAETVTDATPADYENVLEDEASSEEEDAEDHAALDEEPVEEASFEDEYEDEANESPVPAFSAEFVEQMQEDTAEVDAGEVDAGADALVEPQEDLAEAELPETFDAYEEDNMELSPETLAAFAEELPEEDAVALSGQLENTSEDSLSEEIEDGYASYQSTEELLDLEEDQPEISEFEEEFGETTEAAISEDLVEDEVAEDDIALEDHAEEDVKPRLDVLTLVNPINTGTDSDDDFETALEAELEQVEEEEQPKPRVVVQHISRADLLANLSDEVASENADDQASDDADVVDIEAELARELSAMDTFEEEAEEEELGTEDMEALQSMLAESAQAEAEDARQARIERRTQQPFEDGEAALSRLMDEASKVEEDNEGTIRRASIAHLKAAVAATKADASIAEAAAAEDEREMDQYREDLARVVRPGRARKRSDGETTSRPDLASETKQPLVLVGEQRIEDEGAQAPSTASVQPRRISASELALQEEDDLGAQDHAPVEDGLSFAEYADAMEASELPDLLEAAAAHTIYIEGMSSFTRPMLMRKMDTVNQDGVYTRETILRSFGTLLRQGKIIKNKDGNFVIAKTSRFTPEARYAGE